MDASDFLWGTSTSSHQVEGDNKLNDWWQWEQAGKLKDPSNKACDHWNRFREDFEIAAKLGHKAHRFSIEWSRLEPENNVWDEDVFRHYEDVLKELQARNIQPLVTLHHFTNPQWFSDLGGWHNPQSTHFFRRYTRKVVQAFGKYVNYWITINEPLVLIHFGYLEGTWPPGIKDFGRAIEAVRHLLHSHVASYEEIHSHYREQGYKTPSVSVAKHMSYFVPYREGSSADRLSIYLRSWFFNHLFIQAAHSGFLFFPGVFCEPLARHSTLDYIGLNYYMRHIIKFGGAPGLMGLLGEMREDTKTLEQNFLGWEVCPEGLFELLRQLKRYKLPIIVTENGICTQDDTQRSQFIKSHLKAVKAARSEGIAVEGYFHWSLMDNFEWAEGYAPHFGIVEIDYANFQRKIRPSAYVLSNECRNL